MSKLIIYLKIVNIASFIIYGTDKLLAIKQQSRISETALLTLSLIGGSIGALLGMIIFHHKTKKIKFILLNPLFLIIQIFIFFINIS